LQAALRESQEAGERVELTLTERMRQLTAAAAGAQVSWCHRARIPFSLPLRVAKTGRNHLNEEFTPLLPTGIGERF
jgi:hypothetical protein